MGKFEFGISDWKNNKLNLLIDSCNLENIISFLGWNTSKTDIPSEFFAMEANIHQDSIFLKKVFVN